MYSYVFKFEHLARLLRLTAEIQHPLADEVRKPLEPTSDNLPALILRAQRFLDLRRDLGHFHPYIAQIEALAGELAAGYPEWADARRTVAADVERREAAKRAEADVAKAREAAIESVLAEARAQEAAAATAAAPKPKGRAA